MNFRGEFFGFAFVAVCCSVIGCGPGDAGHDVVPGDLDGYVEDRIHDEGVPDEGGDSGQRDQGSADYVDFDADSVGDQGGDVSADDLPDGQGDDSGPDAAIDGDLADDSNAGDAVIDIPADGDAVQGDDVPESCDPILFPMAMIKETETAACQFTNHRTVIKEGLLMDLWDVSFVSWESIDCNLVPITIRGFASKPAGSSGKIPGLVQMHGLGGCADPDNATGPAALLGYFVIAPTGPGGAPSTNSPDCAASGGLPSGHDSGRRMFDTYPDPRGSWFWGHSVAAMRAVTCLTTSADVDSTRLGMTGYSAGAVATLISSAVDDRIKVSVPLSGTGAWGVATESANAWQHSLLTLAGMDVASPEWQRLISTILPDVNMAGSTTRILMVNGSSDEFFPLTAHMVTYNSIPGTDKRTAIIGNGDHGCCLLIDKLCGLEDTETIEARAELAAKGNQKAWFHRWFGTDPDFSYYPNAPEAQVNPVGGAMYVLAAVDGGGSKMDVESVRFWLSNDLAMNFFSQEMKFNDTLKMWDATIPVAAGPNDIWYVEVVYTDGALVFPDKFLLTSVPRLPGGLVPAIHPINSCVP